MFSAFDLAAILLTLSALFGWLNLRFVRLPHSVGLVVIALFASLLVIVLETLFPDQQVYQRIVGPLRQIDFTKVVMNGMLAFLLFAGALHVNLRALRDRALPVGFLALVGTLISTLIVGLVFYAVAQALGTDVSLAWAFVFGALISPTDPVAVLGTLKNVRAPEVLRAQIQGEALFNDGIGVVLFTLFLGLATGSGQETFDLVALLLDLVREAGGGLLLGALTGFLAYKAMSAVDDFPVEVLITLAVVAGTYSAAQKLGVSGPLSVVAAGLLIGYRAPVYAMSDTTHEYVSALWTMVDEVLNSVLFVLIGLEVLVLADVRSALAPAIIAVPVVLAARLVAVSAPLLVFRWTHALFVRNVPFLTWAGVRGGISIALALSLPHVAVRPVILSATYAVVLFAVIVQGGTLERVARLTLDDQD